MTNNNKVSIFCLFILILLFSFIFYKERYDPQPSVQISQQRNNNVTYIKPQMVTLLDDDLTVVGQQNKELPIPIIESRTRQNSFATQVSALTYDDFEEEFQFRIDDRKFGSFGETLACQVVEEYLGYQTKVNKYYDFLPNPIKKNGKITGKTLQLDIYDPKTKIALEYQGVQHLIDCGAFGMSTEDFEYQVAKDKAKVEMCKKEGIILIVVPCTVDDIELDPKLKRGYRKIKREPEERLQLLRSFIEPKLKAALHQRKY